MLKLTINKLKILTSERQTPEDYIYLRYSGGGTRSLNYVKDKKV